MDFAEGYKIQNFSVVLNYSFFHGNDGNLQLNRMKKCDINVFCPH